MNATLIGRQKLMAELEFYVASKEAGMEKKELKKLKQCIICFEASASVEEIIQCPDHYTCQECFSGFVSSVINKEETTQIVCPYPKCGFDYYLRLDSDNLSQLKRNRSLASVRLRKCKKCHGSLQLGRFYSKYKNRFELNCTNCGTDYCLCCFEDLNNSWSSFMVNFFQVHSCNDPVSNKLLKSLRDVSNKTIKPCPHCFELIQRIDGCRNMVHSNGCNHGFCFDCLANNQQHHCLVSPPTRTMVNHAIRVGETFKVAARAMFTVTCFPYLYYRKIQEDKKCNLDLVKFKSRQIIVRGGVDVFVKSPTEVNDFAKKYPEGRWSEDDQCFGSYQVLKQGIVRLHNHPPNVQCNFTPAEIQTEVDSLLDISDLHYACITAIVKKFPHESFQSIDQWDSTS